MKCLRLASIAFALLTATTLSHANNIRIAERPTAGPFTTIQSAVDAAFEGETLLATAGTYPPFTIDGKAVSLYATGTGDVSITGTITIKNLAAPQSLVLSRLKAKGTTNGQLPGLLITNVSGHVRAQDCTFDGPNFNDQTPGAGPAVRVSASFNTVFVSCTMLGANGNQNAGGDPASAGGAGLESLNSMLALYDCLLVGGIGSYESQPAGGLGGFGCTISGIGLFASACTFQGGRGGHGDYVNCCPGGVGGVGLRIDAAAASLLGCATNGGNGGLAGCGAGNSAPGAPIATVNGAILEQMTGTPRRIQAPRLAADDSAASITIVGEPGDVVYLLPARKPYFQFQPLLKGVRLVPKLLLSSALPVGTIGAGGSLVVPSTFTLLDGYTPAQMSWLQALCIDTQGLVRLSGPAQLLSFDAASGPDCNGNSRQDVIDVALGGAGDCDGDLTPDACQQDCNGNGILDSCDIASHTSPDVNGNGIPDECEAQFITWYVDASAAPGGNGSQAAPFQSLQPAVAAAFGGDTIVMADGVYLGASNFNIDFGGRDLTLRSANGPANCIIDPQNQGRVLNLHTFETVTLEGLTFRQAAIVGSGGAINADTVDLTIRDCRFESCWATFGGGAIHRRAGELRLERCRFTGCATTSSLNRGGALHTIDGGGVQLRECDFIGNSSEEGGAFYLGQWLSSPAVITHCRFLANQAKRGGAGMAPYAGTGVRHLIDDCLFAGNVATDDGGALWLIAPTDITSSTFVANSAVDRGGSILCWPGTGSSWNLANSILCDSSATLGRQVCVSNGGSSGVSLAISYSELQSGQAGVVMLSGVLNWGSGNTSLDPQFSDPDGADNNPATFGDNDYSLSSSSPCIDAGDNAALIADLLDVDGDGDVREAMPLDLLRMPRRFDVVAVPNTGAGVAPIVDMGAYERQR